MLLFLNSQECWRCKRKLRAVIGRVHGIYTGVWSRGELYLTWWRHPTSLTMGAHLGAWRVGATRRCCTDSPISLPQGSTLRPWESFFGQLNGCTSFLYRCRHKSFCWTCVQATQSHSRLFTPIAVSWACLLFFLCKTNRIHNDFRSLFLLLCLSSSEHSQHCINFMELPACRWKWTKDAAEKLSHFAPEKFQNSFVAWTWDEFLSLHFFPFCQNHSQKSAILDSKI